MEAGRVKEFGPAQELLASPGSAFRKMADDAGVLSSSRNSLHSSDSTFL